MWVLPFRANIESCRSFGLCARTSSDCDFRLRFFIVNGCKCVIKIIVNVNAVNSVKQS